MLTTLFSSLPLDVLFIRVVSTAFVVIAVAWSVGVLGPFIGGAVAGLPIVLGPGFYFLILQEPTPFVAEAAAYALFSLCATQLFLFAYIATANKGRPFMSIGCAVATWSLMACLLQIFPSNPIIGIALFIATTIISLRIGTRFTVPAPPIKSKAGFGLLLMRGILAGTLVAIVTATSQKLGSTWAGLLMAFPIGYAVIAVTIHQNFGSANVTATLYSALLGTASLAAFCASIALIIPYWQGMGALGIALVVSFLLTSALVLRQRALRGQSAHCQTERPTIVKP